MMERDREVKLIKHLAGKLLEAIMDLISQNQVFPEKESFDFMIEVVLNFPKLLDASMIIEKLSNLMANSS